MAKPYPKEDHLIGNFAPIRMESSIDDVIIEGEIPKEINGTYYRNGPDPKFPPRGDSSHWFGGDGMIHAFHVNDGKVSYLNRWMKTVKWKKEHEEQKALWSSGMDVMNNDPSVSNIIDVYMLERTYDNLFRIWLQDGGTKPSASTSDQLRINYSGTLDPLKSLSDQIIYHPVKYKILFGSNADEELQATFKVVKNTKTNVTDAVIKTRVISAINEFFALDNWDFGDSFYYTELAAYVHNQLAPDLLTAVIVPNQTGQTFGSLFQINSAADEIFISGATVDDVSIITALGANQLAASGTVVTSTSTCDIPTLAYSPHTGNLPIRYSVVKLSNEAFTVSSVEVELVD